MSVLTSAPARSKAAAESYSQLLPGEHGDDHMRLGGAGAVYTVFFGALKDTVSTVLPFSSPLDRYGNTDSMPPPKRPAVRPDPASHRLPRLVDLGGLADLTDLNQVGYGRNLRGVGKFDDEGTIGRGEQVVHADAIGQLHADLVADSHLEDSLGGGTVARRGHGQRIAEIGELLDCGEHLQQRILVRCEAVGW